jgi:uncharacterized protein (DUF2141 family)
MRTLLLLPLLLAIAPARAADLVVTVEGVRNNAGNIRAGIFNSAETWLDGDKALARVAVKAVAPRTVLKFENLAPGTYAVGFYHDENENQKHDRNFLGVPVEGFGFTRDPTVVLSPPSFAECTIEVPAAGAEVSVHVKY